MIKIAVILETCEGGGFTASVPTIPGCFSEGETVEEALANIAEAIELHLEATEDDLIAGDDALVKELVWQACGSGPEITRPEPAGASPSTGTATQVNPGRDRPEPVTPQTLASARTGRAIELDDSEDVETGSS